MTSSDDGGKKTLPLTKPGPHEAKTEEIVTLPIILGEVRMLRTERREHDAWTGEQFEKIGRQFGLVHDQIVTLDGGVKTLAQQVQSNYETTNHKIRAGEVRMDSLEERAKQLETFKAEVEKELKIVRTEQAKLLGLSPDALEAAKSEVRRQVSLSEDQMQAKLEEEAKERAAVAKTAENTATEVKMLSTMLVQSLGLRPPPMPAQPNADGSIPPVSEGKEKAKKEPRNVIQQQTFWVKVTGGLIGLVGASGALDKAGALDEIGRLIMKIFGH